VPYKDPLTADTVLVRGAIQSPNYVPGVSGWIVRIDGSSEFSDTVIRGDVDVVGINGGHIKMIPDGGLTGILPTIQLISPDETNFAFINVVSPGVGQAELGINSGKYTPPDGTLRYWRIFAADNNAIMQVVKESNQSSFGGYLQQSSTAANFGYRNEDAGFFNLISVDRDQIFILSDLIDPIDFRNNGVRVPWGGLINEHSNAANTATATEAKDVIGDSSFTAVVNRRYEFTYITRIISTAAAGNVDARIRGNNSNVSPTTASQILASASVTTLTGGGSGGTQMVCQQTRVCRAVPGAGEIAPGLWTVAPFYARVAGAATANADNATGQFREFRVNEIGGT
jgi:hypothetical protein